MNFAQNQRKHHSPVDILQTQKKF